VDLSAHGCKECGQRPLFPAAAGEAVDLPCAVCLGRIRTGLLGYIDEIDAVAHQLYIGRSNYPERRLLEHFSSPDKIRHGETWASEVAPNRLSVLHWSASWQEVADLEKSLIAEYQRRGKLKLLNADAESWGRWDGAWNCLYVLWAGKRSVKSDTLPRAKTVEHLQWASIQPDRAQWRIPPQHLTVGDALGTPEAAKHEVAALSERRGAFLQTLKGPTGRNRRSPKSRHQELPWQS
jgi:hypothetical protein